jgi:hypothetical protein
MKKRLTLQILYSIINVSIMSLKALAVFQVFILAKLRISKLLSQNFSFGKASLFSFLRESAHNVTVLWTD